jgi:hypothetical protein
VGTPPRYLMAGVFVCLRIFPSATVLVAVLFVAACGAGVPALDVEPTGEAHVPVVVVFYWVGRSAGRMNGRRRDAKCCRWNVKRGGMGCWGKVLLCLASLGTTASSSPISTPGSSSSKLILLVWCRRGRGILLLP